MAPAATTLTSESNGNSSVGALGTTVSGKKLRIRSYPKFETLEEERLYRKQHLAAAFRVLVPLPDRYHMPELTILTTASLSEVSTRALLAICKLNLNQPKGRKKKNETLTRTQIRPRSDTHRSLLAQPPFSALLTNMRL